MSSPIVLIFERHWDTFPKRIVEEHLQELHRAGISCVCLEFPQNLSAKQIQDLLDQGAKKDLALKDYAEKRLKEIGADFFHSQGLFLEKDLSDTNFGSLAEFARICVSSKQYLAAAERIKQLPASLIINKLWQNAPKHAIDVQGIDIDADRFSSLISTDIPDRMAAARANEWLRLPTMIQNLLKIRKEKEGGVLFICGAFHAKGILDTFAKLGMQEDILYYMPHNEKRYSQDLDDIALITEDHALKGHIYSLQESQIPIIAKKILKDIASKTRYLGVIEKNSHAEYISQQFGVFCKALVRAQDHVDVLLPVQGASAAVQSLTEKGMFFSEVFWQEEKYIAVCNVNDPLNAASLHKKEKEKPSS